MYPCFTFHVALLEPIFEIASIFCNCVMVLKCIIFLRQYTVAQYILFLCFCIGKAEFDVETDDTIIVDTNGRFF